MNILKILTPRRIIGNLGERAAAKYLKRKGYKILKLNYVESGHEIDIIAENSEYLCFVEVKTRTIDATNPHESRPSAAVNPKKQRSIIAAAGPFVAIYPKKDRKIRFDVAEVYLNKDGSIDKICYLENTFNHNTAFVMPWKK